MPYRSTTKECNENRYKMKKATSTSTAFIGYASKEANRSPRSGLKSLPLVLEERIKFDEAQTVLVPAVSFPRVFVSDRRFR